MQLSRRQFLQFAGITLIGSAFPFPGAELFSTPPTKAINGRALEAVSVYARPQLAADVIGQLWPDSIVELKAAFPGWYALARGFVPRSQIQPMQPYHPHLKVPVPDLPFWAEVSAPVAPLRTWCAADAPPVTRIGYGGVGRVIDLLPDAQRDGAWYGLAGPDGTLLGWSQAVFWQPVPEINAARLPLQIEVNRQEHSIEVYSAEKLFLKASIATGSHLEVGEYLLVRGMVSGNSTLNGATYHGVPWILEFAGNTMSGVYWHNSFGQRMAGPAIQLTPTLARWLYQTLHEAQMRIR